VDIRPVDIPKCNTYPRVAFIQEGAENPRFDARFGIQPVWLDNVPQEFLLTMPGFLDPYDRSPTYDPESWYRHRIDYDAEAQTFVWTISLQDTGELFYTATYTDISLGPFNQVAIGFQDKISPLSDWAEIYVDNIKLESCLEPVEPVLRLLTPNGDETLISGRDYMIEWEKGGPIEDVLILYSTDNGQDWAFLDVRVR